MGSTDDSLILAGMLVPLSVGESVSNLRACVAAKGAKLTSMVKAREDVSAFLVFPFTPADLRANELALSRVNSRKYICPFVYIVYQLSFPEYTSDECNRSTRYFETLLAKREGLQLAGRICCQKPFWLLGVAVVEFVSYFFSFSYFFLYLLAMESNSRIDFL